MCLIARGGSHKRLLGVEGWKGVEGVCVGGGGRGQTRPRPLIKPRIFFHCSGLDTDAVPRTNQSSAPLVIDSHPF